MYMVPKVVAFEDIGSWKAVEVHYDVRLPGCISDVTKHWCEQVDIDVVLFFVCRH